MIVLHLIGRRFQLSNSKQFEELDFKRYQNIKIKKCWDREFSLFILRFLFTLVLSNDKRYQKSKNISKN